MKDFKDKTILITGAAGYIGSRLVRKYVNIGAKVIALDIKYENNHKSDFSNSDVTFLTLDILDKKKIFEELSHYDLDYIYHLAALLNRDRDFQLFEVMINTNVNGTYNLLNALKDKKYSGFYFFSTSDVYGVKNIAPFDERMNADPVSLYSLTKYLAEKVVSTFSINYKKPFTILRPFLFHGPNLPDSLFLGQLQKSLEQNCVFEMTEGEQIRDFISIDDLINKLIVLTKYEGFNNEIVNICSGKGIKIKDLAISYADSCGKKDLLRIGSLPYRKNEIWNAVGDASKFESIINTARCCDEL